MYGTDLEEPGDLGNSRIQALGYEDGASQGVDEGELIKLEDDVMSGGRPLNSNEVYLTGTLD